MLKWSTLIALTMLSSVPALAIDPGDFELLDGDRVVFVGNTFMERDQVYGFLETSLTAQWPDRNVTFRNLGWSGDTVWGEARARFGTPADGFQHLKDHVDAIKPSVIFVSYGLNESFDGSSGLPRFREGLEKLLNMLTVHTRRVVLLSPIPLEAVKSELVAQHNQMLAAYSNVIAEFARDRGFHFVDLMRDWNERSRGWPEPGMFWTDNGMHLSALGYWHSAEQIMDELGLRRGNSPVVISVDGQVANDGAGIFELRRAEAGYRFGLRMPLLPVASLPTPTVGESARLRELGYPVTAPRTCLVRIAGLPPGERVELRIDGKKVVTESSLTWAEGCRLPVLDLEQVEQLRRAIVAKNQLYFHRWRPQNETYLFGFRKHEQGQNAAEVPKFDPLVAEQEAVIAQLRVPARHYGELIQQRTRGEGK